MDNFTTYTFYFFVMAISTVLFLFLGHAYGHDWMLWKRERLDKVTTRWCFLMTLFFFTVASVTATIATVMIRLAVKSW